MPARITESIRSQILPLYKTGLSYREVADKLGISHVTVGRIVRESGYDRTHVGGKVARTISTDALTSAPTRPSEAPQSRVPFRVTARALKLLGAATGFSYKVSTESSVVEIESDTCLMSIEVNHLDDFIQELKGIVKMLGNPS